MKRVRFRPTAGLVLAIGLGPGFLPAQDFSADSLTITQISDDSLRIRKMADLAVNAPFQYGQTTRHGLATLALARRWHEARRPPSRFLNAYLTDRSARLQQAAGRPAEALAGFQRALQEFRAIGHHEFIVKTLQRIAALYTELAKTDESERYINQSLAHLRAHPLADLSQTRWLQAIGYEYLSTIESRRGRVAQGLVHLKKAQALFLQNGDALEYRTLLVNEAIQYKKLGRFAEAVATNYRAEAEFKRAGQRDELAYVYSNLPGALMGLGRYDEARTYAERALVLADSMPERWAFREDLFRTLSEIHERQGDYAAALAAYKQHKTAHDTLFNQAQRQQLQTLEVQYQTRQQDERIATLDAQNSARQRQVLGLGIGAGLLLVLAGGLYALTLRLRRSQRRIQQQSDQLHLLMRELHHRVKNNLATVSGLLELQGNRLGDETARRAFAEGRQRVQAMALLHQRLYQAETPTTVEPGEYFADLVRTLSEAYGYAPGSLRVELNVAVRELDVDTAIPLGLILNELLTNAFKHALPQTPDPRLTVQLRAEDRALELLVADNGPGLDPAHWHRPGGSFGKRLVAALADQLGGTLRLENSGGTRFVLRFPYTAAPVIGVRATSEAA